MAARLRHRQDENIRRQRAGFVSALAAMDTHAIHKKRKGYSMSCFIIGAGSFYGLPVPIQSTDTVIAADGGWEVCRQLHITPTLLVADFDSLGAPPDFDHILRLPVVKDDTDMIRAVKEGFACGESEFHLLGGMGGRRTDHTVANMQTLAYIARRGGRGWLYGSGERFTAICDGGEVVFPARGSGILSVFCMGADAEGVTIQGAQYPLEDAKLTADFPLGVSNHFIGSAVRVAVRRGCLLIGICDKE